MEKQFLPDVKCKPSDVRHDTPLKGAFAVLVNGKNRQKSMQVNKHPLRADRLSTVRDK
jgi:hypothetical protein